MSSGNWQKNVATARAKCIPEQRCFDCKGCERLAGNEAFAAWMPVIDATKAAWPDGVCPMRITGDLLCVELEAA